VSDPIRSCNLLFAQEYGPRGRSWPADVERAYRAMTALLVQTAELARADERRQARQEVRRELLDLFPEETQVWSF